MKRFALLPTLALVAACGQELTTPTLTEHPQLAGDVQLARDVTRTGNIAPLITNGELDGEDHPFVGLMVALTEEGQPLWRCSGTLISPTVFLTAGHCTSGAPRATIWFDADVEAGLPGNNYPFAGDVFGRTYTHPDYRPAAFVLYDLGVVVLEEPVDMGGFGELPQLGALDAIPASARKGAITAVGYGLQKINPVEVIGYKARLRAGLNIIDLTGTAGIPAGTSVAISANARTGGTCFGDSGGPQFLTGTNVIVAVTSYGLNGNCVGVAGGYRVDQPDDLSWLSQFVGN